MAISVPAVWLLNRGEVTVRQASAARPESGSELGAPKETGFWSAATTVKAPAHADRTPIELGMRFTPAQGGWVTGVRFYKARGEKGRHTGSLWDSRGRRLAQVSFAGERPSGWQEARFASPVRLEATRVYTVSYHSENGTYVGSRGFGATRSGPLTTATRTPGVFGYGGSVFPRRSNPKGYNYWVDVIFRWHHRPPGHNTPSPEPPPSPSATTSESQEPEATPGPSTIEPTPSLPGSPEPTPSTTPSETATPAPSPTVTRTPPPVPPTPTASPTPTRSTPLPTLTVDPSHSPIPDDGACAYPTPACTGVPPGVKLAELALNEDNAAYRVTSPGAVLDGKHIRGDLLIHADNVTIRNSRIDGTVINANGPKTFRFTITDSTVGPPTGCETLPGIGQDKYTALRVHIRNHGDGFRAAGDDVVIRDSYVHLCSNPDDHSDGIQTYHTGENLIFDHNTVDQRDAKDITAPIFLTDSQIVNASVTNNLIMGGTYSIQLRNGRGKLVVRDNRLVDKSWEYAPVESDCAKIDWAGNTLVTIDKNYRITSTVGPLPCK
ncbi:DUF4082 domain-containing protein [Streptosporangium sp. NPDC004631]